MSVDKAIAQDIETLIGHVPNVPPVVPVVAKQGVQVLEVPPVCDVCERMVKQKSSKPFLLGCDAMLCLDCWYEWYDGDCSSDDGNGRDPMKIKANVLRDHGEWGGAGGLGWDVYMRVSLGF